MALTLTVGTNTYVTLAEANAYLEGKFGADGWFSLTDTVKKQCLITAYRWIVRLGVSPTSTANNVKSAQVELAWWIYQRYAEYEDREALYAGGVRDFTVLKWSEELEAPDVPSFIKDLIGEEIGLGGFFPEFSRELESDN
jgi:hypothetical protein